MIAAKCFFIFHHQAGLANGGDGLAGQVIHYPTDIQPILDAKCVRCHEGPDDPPPHDDRPGSFRVAAWASNVALGERDVETKEPDESAAVPAG